MTAAASPSGFLQRKLQANGITHHAVMGGAGLPIPLVRDNLDRFTAFVAENPFPDRWFAFRAQPHLPAPQFGHPGVLEQTRLVAEDVSGEMIPFCGQLLAEEQPEAVARAILDFCARLGATPG
jgi:hypothetical protein